MSPLAAFLQWTTHDPVAFYTFVVALFTGVLGASTIGLWIVTARGVRNQARDTEILQRAYVSVEPAGIALHYNKGDRVVGNVTLRNVGNLPARNVRWCEKMEWRGFSYSDDIENFPIEDPSGDGIVLAPGASTPVEMGLLTLNDKWGTMIFVWGIITYDDGFGNGRYTKFCHRYRMRHVTSEALNALGGVPVRDAALHWHGNDAD